MDWEVDPTVDRRQDIDAPGVEAGDHFGVAAIPVRHLLRDFSIATGS
jgi:hypothetical protein